MEGLMNTKKRVRDMSRRWSMDIGHKVKVVTMDRSQGPHLRRGQGTHGEARKKAVLQFYNSVFPNSFL